MQWPVLISPTRERQATECGHVRLARAVLWLISSDNKRDTSGGGVKM